MASPTALGRQLTLTVDPTLETGRMALAMAKELTSAVPTATQVIGISMSVTARERKKTGKLAPLIQAISRTICDMERVRSSGTRETPTLVIGTTGSSTGEGATRAR